jgi:hypothetical protein
MHDAMAKMHRAHGSRIAINWTLETTYEALDGSFCTLDGVLVVANPKFD